MAADDDASSVSSVSTQATHGLTADDASSRRGILGLGHGRSASVHSGRSPRSSGDFTREKVVLYREDQRVSLRAFLRTYLQNEQTSRSKAMEEFLIGNPIKLNEEELEDLDRRKQMDERRIEEQRRFYEIARQRARELDVYMEKFRRDVVERSKSDQPLCCFYAKAFPDGLTKLFQEIKEKEKIADLTVEYQKFAEWLRIE